MTYISERDFLIEVAKGNIPGHSIVHKFGRNDGVASGAWELVSLLSAATSFRSSAATVRIKAGGNAADDSGGAGAREVTVQGIAADLTETSEAITTAGSSASSATSTSFWRVHRAWVSSSGAYGAANTGTVTIEDSGGAADMISIGAAEGQSQHAAFSIPTGKTGYLLGLYVTVDGNKAADIRLLTRDNLNDTSVPVSAPRIKRYFDGVLGSLQMITRGPSVTLSALTDIWVEANGSGASTEVSADFELLLVDN